MLKEVIEVKAGYEEIHAKLIEKKENIEAEIRKKVEAETLILEELIGKVTEVKTVEVPDEPVEEQVENTETITY